MNINLQGDKVNIKIRLYFISPPREVLPVGLFLGRFLCTNSMQRVGCVCLYLWIESLLLAWKTLRFSVKCKKINHSIKIPLLFSKLSTDNLQFQKFVPSKHSNLGNLTYRSLLFTPRIFWWHIHVAHKIYFFMREQNL